MFFMSSKNRACRGLNLFLVQILISFGSFSLWYHDQKKTKSNCFRLYDIWFLTLCLKELKGHFSFCRYEQAFLTTLLLEKRTSFWIGFNDRHVEGSFFWTDNSPRKYTNWNVNEPQNRGWSRDCVDMTPFGDAGRWGTVQCWQKKGYICETGLWHKILSTGVVNALSLSWLVYQM